jgi:hypothetical protein
LAELEVKMDMARTKSRIMRLYICGIILKIAKIVKHER